MFSSVWGVLRLSQACDDVITWKKSNCTYKSSDFIGKEITICMKNEVKCDNVDTNVLVEGKTGFLSGCECLA